MELIFRICLTIVGIINLLPSVLTFLPHKISKSYGVEMNDANVELLLRHRATMFGLVGGLLIYAAITKKMYEVSTFAGLFSMLSFVLLYFLIGKESINAELTKVMQIDVVAIVILLLGFCLYHFN